MLKEVKNHKIVNIVVSIMLFLCWFVMKALNLSCIIKYKSIMPDLPSGCSEESIILQRKINSFASLLDFCRIQSNKEYGGKKNKSLRMMISKLSLSEEIISFPSKFQVMEFSVRI